MYKLIGIAVCGIFGLVLRHFMWIGKSWKSKGMGLVIAIFGSVFISGFIEAWEEDNRPMKRQPQPESDPLNLSDDDYCGNCGMCSDCEDADMEAWSRGLDPSIIYKRNRVQDV
jgi:MoaA/NifB/PqqE/SkfB family radical SAM enzyme